eukprot:scaffold32061_cov48-Phaeocystis_antarctica.AAC.2
MCTIFWCSLWRAALRCNVGVWQAEEPPCELRLGGPPDRAQPQPRSRLGDIGEQGGDSCWAWVASESLGAARWLGAARYAGAGGVFGGGGGGLGPTLAGRTWRARSDAISVRRFSRNNCRSR